jgi:hypothetical protein
VEEKWTKKDIFTMRTNVFIGFPLGALLSVAITAVAALVLLPNNIVGNDLGQSAIPVGVASGKIALAVAILGFVAATFGAAWRPCCRAGTASASTSAGNGASSSGPARPAGFTWWSCSR